MGFSPKRWSNSLTASSGRKMPRFDELLKMPPQVGASQQLKPTQALKNPNSAVILEAIALGELSAPRIVYNGRGSELCSLDSDFGFPSVLVLNDGFGLATGFRPLRATFNQ